MEYVIIKLYLNEMQGDCHDIHIEDFEATLKEMQGYAKSINRKLFFAPITNDGSIGLPVDCTPFAEIEYTCNLEKAEKASFITFLKRLSVDAKIEKGYLCEFNTLRMVTFKKIEAEIFELL